METLGGALAASCERRRTAAALECDGIVYSFAVLDARAATAAGALLAHGIRPGDRVAVGLPNSVDLVVAVVAVLRAGAVLVPLNPAASEEERCYIVADAGAR